MAGSEQRSALHAPITFPATPPLSALRGRPGVSWRASSCRRSRPGVGAKGPRTLTCELAPQELSGRRARQLRRELDGLWHLEPGDAPRSTRAARRRPARPRSRATTRATTASPTPGPRARTLPRRATAGCASSTASTSAGAMFSPPLTIVSAPAADDRQPPPSRTPPVAGVQPAISSTARRRDHRCPPTRISPFLARAAARRRQRQAEGRDLRTRFGHPVARRHRHASGGCALQQRRRDRAAAEQRPAQRRRPRNPASSSRQSIVGTSETIVIRASGSISAASTARGVEALVQDHGGRVDRAAYLDRQPADVRERHRAQPPLVRVQPQRNAPSRTHWRASCRK